jgi:deazaflavin-dependent oxidoreductase (nitroreductase family)
MTRYGRVVHETGRAPWWLKVVNPVNAYLLRRGIGPAPQHLLSIRGRRTGILRTTPVAVVVVDDARYAVAGFAGSDWVRNARAAGRGELRRGALVERIALTEVAVGDRGPILRTFAERVPGGRSFLTLGAGAADFDGAAPNHPVFRIESIVD